MDPHDPEILGSNHHRLSAYSLSMIAVALVAEGQSASTPLAPF
jgi:hypothetical protein